MIHQSIVYHYKIYISILFITCIHSMPTICMEDYEKTGDREYFVGEAPKSKIGICVNYDDLVQYNNSSHSIVNAAKQLSGVFWQYPSLVFKIHHIQQTAEEIAQTTAGTSHVVAALTQHMDETYQYSFEEKIHEQMRSLAVTPSRNNVLYERCKEIRSEHALLLYSTKRDLYDVQESNKKLEALKTPIDDCYDWCITRACTQTMKNVSDKGYLVIDTEKKIVITHETYPKFAFLKRLSTFAQDKDLEQLYITGSVSSPSVLPTTAIPIEFVDLASIQ